MISFLEMFTSCFPSGFDNDFVHLNETIWLQLLVHGMDIIDVICSNENMIQSNFSVQSYKYSSRSTIALILYYFYRNTQLYQCLFQNFGGDASPHPPRWLRHCTRSPSRSVEVPGDRKASLFPKLYSSVCLLANGN